MRLLGVSTLNKDMLQTTGPWPHLDICPRDSEDCCGSETRGPSPASVRVSMYPERAACARGPEPQRVPSQQVPVSHFMAGAPTRPRFPQ